nr:hypothetical protein [Tanacetum cinerariifolium]
MHNGSCIIKDTKDPSWTTNFKTRRTQKTSSALKDFNDRNIAKTINGEVQLHAKVEGTKIIVTELSVRRDLRLADEKGIDCLPNSTIFELALMGGKLIQLMHNGSCIIKDTKDPSWTTNFKTRRTQKTSSALEDFNDRNIAKTINGEVQLHAKVEGTKIIVTELSVRRDLRLADEKGIDCLPNSTIFEQLALMGLGKGFSGRVTPLLPTIAVQNQSELGESLAMPTDPHHTPTILQPSSSQPQKTQKPKNPKRKDTQVPQPSNPTESVANEAIHKELGDRLNPLEIKKSLGEDASKQERMIDDIDSNEEITLIYVQDDAEMFDVNDLGGEEVFVAKQNENVVKEVVNAAQVSTAATTVTITTKEITLAQVLEALKT